MSSKTLLFVINVDWYFKLHWLQRALSARDAGYSIHVATSITKKNFIKELEAKNFTVHSIFLKRKTLNPFSSINSIFSIYKIIKKVDPDLIHSITVKPNLFAGIICRLLSIPQVMSVTGLGGAFSRRSVVAIMTRVFVMYGYRLLASERFLKIIFENYDDCSEFVNRKIAPESICNVIQGAGVDIEQFKYSMEEAQASPPIVLFAARLLQDKGLDDLIVAIKNLKKKGVLVSLHVAGILDFDNHRAISENTVLNWHHLGDIVWLGQVNEMPELIKQASIIALPTTYGEGVPRVLIEAAAVGRPIVATDVVGCRDIVINEVSGFLVKPNSPDDLEAAIEKLVNSLEVRNKFGRSGHRLVVDCFSQDLVIEKTLQVYLSLIE